MCITASITRQAKGRKCVLTTKWEMFSWFINCSVASNIFFYKKSHMLFFLFKIKKFVPLFLLFQEDLNTLYPTILCFKKVTYTFHFKCGFFNENIVMSVHAKQMHINMRLHLSHINIHAWIHISTQSQFSDHLCDGWWMQWINFICEGSDKSCIFCFSPTISPLRC